MNKIKCAHTAKIVYLRERRGPLKANFQITPIARPYISRRRAKSAGPDSSRDPDELST